MLGSLQDRLPEVIQDESITTSIETAITSLFEGDRVSNAVGSILGVFTNIFYAIVVVPFVTFFFLKDGDRIKQNLLRMVPNRYFEMTLSIVEKVESQYGPVPTRLGSAVRLNWYGCLCTLVLRRSRVRVGSRHIRWVGEYNTVFWPGNGDCQQVLLLELPRLAIFRFSSVF